MYQIHVLVPNMTDDVNPRRAYDSSPPHELARVARARVLVAAHDAFLEQGYAGDHRAGRRRGGRRHPALIAVPTLTTMRALPMICVHDVAASSAWYQAALGLTSVHGGDEFDMLADAAGEVILQLHVWEAHEHALFGSPERPVGNGVAIWMETATATELDDVLARIAAAGATVADGPLFNPLGQHREVWLHDPDGHLVVVASPYGDVPVPSPRPRPTSADVDTRSGVQNGGDRRRSREARSQAYRTELDTGSRGGTVSRGSGSPRCRSARSWRTARRRASRPCRTSACGCRGGGARAAR